MTTTDTTDMTDETDSTETAATTEHIDNGAVELTTRRRSAPVESTYPWNRAQVVIDSETRDEALVVLAKDQTPRPDTSLHIASPALAPAAQPLCHQPLITAASDDEAEVIARRVSDFPDDEVLDRLCGGCATHAVSNVADHLDIERSGHYSEAADPVVAPHVVAGRRIVFFATSGEGQGDRS